MISDIETSINRLFFGEKTLLSVTGKALKIKEIAYFFAENGKVYAVTKNEQNYQVSENLNFLEREFKEHFLRVHRFYLVAVDMIRGVFERYPESEIVTKGGTQDECELELSGIQFYIPVTVTYARKLKKFFGITSLHHLVPENPDDKRFRLYGLIDFGWRELFNIDVLNNAAVESFKRKWDIKQFDKTRMLSYFRMFGVNEIDKRRVIKNIIYQMFRWIKKGIEKPSDGNIRSLWYRIKAVLAYHSNILEPGDVDVYYDVLQEMIEKENFFRYKDFEFMDVNEPYRGVGKLYPEIILASEKLGHYIFIRKLAQEKGVSFICTKGEPAVISMEYFSDDLIQACNGKELTVFCISDVDPAGHSIERNIVRGLQSRGHSIKKVIKLVDTSVFTDEEIAFVRYPIVSYIIKGVQIKPVEPATMSQVTKGRDWFSEINDSRLITEKDNGGGWKTVTIWGIESDAADREIIRKKFLAEFPIRKAFGV